MHTLSIIVLTVLSSVVHGEDTCKFPAVIHSNPSPDNRTNIATGCRFPIDENHSWHLLNLQLEPLEMAATDWKNLLRHYVQHSSCLQFNVHYLILENVVLDRLDINIFCRGGSQSVIIFHSTWDEELKLTACNMISRSCIDFINTKLELQVGKSLQVVQNSSVVTIGAALNDSAEFERVCNCTDFEAYRVLLYDYLDYPMVDFDTSVSDAIRLNKRNLHRSTAEHDPMPDMIVPIFFVGVGLIMFFALYGLDCFKLGRNY